MSIPTKSTTTSPENFGKLTFDVSQFVVQIETSNLTQQAEVLNYFMNLNLTNPASRMSVISQSGKPWVCIDILLGDQPDGKKVNDVINQLKTTKHKVKIIL